MSVMLSMLRRHDGARPAERGGRTVVAHFGSVASELAVCRIAVGLAERSDRATLEVRGTRAELDRALGRLATLGDAVWWSRLSRVRAIMRCEAQDRDVCVAVVERDAIVCVHDLGDELAAPTLIGPRAEDVLAAAGLDRDPDAAIVLRDRGGCIELLVPRRLGPALWSRLLDAGERHLIACVGLDAIEQLTVSRELDLRRRIALGYPRGGPPNSATLTSR